MEYNFCVENEVVTFEAGSINIGSDGNAYLFDEEGSLHIVVKKWDWVIIEESDPEVT